MKSHYLRLSWMLSSVLLAACKPESAAPSKPDFSVGGASPMECGPITEGVTETIGCLVGTVGHEHLTRIAAIRAHDMTQSPAYRIALSEIGTGSGGDSSQDNIVIGNYATDKSIFFDVFDLAQWHSDLFGVDKGENWHESGKRQMFHSLSNFTVDDNRPESLSSVKETCAAVQNVIKVQTQKGIELIRAGNLTAGWRLIGSVTHTIQDSFSRAHTVRPQIKVEDDGKFLKSRIWGLERFCKYGEAVPGVCEHEIYHDFVSELGPLGGPFKAEARAATDTTTAYLVYVYWIQEQKISLEEAMKDFFDGSSRFIAFAKSFYSERQQRTIMTIGNFQCTES